MRPISALVPPSTRRPGFGSILGKLSMAERTARKMTRSDVVNMNSAACRALGSASHAHNACGKGGSSDKSPNRQGSAVSMFRKCLKTMAPQLGLEP